MPLFDLASIKRGFMVVPRLEQFGRDDRKGAFALLLQTLQRLLFRFAMLGLELQLLRPISVSHRWQAVGHKPAIRTRSALSFVRSLAQYLGQD